MRITLSQNVFEAMMNKITERPFKEVFALWNKVQKDMKMDYEDEATKAPKDPEVQNR